MIQHLNIREFLKEAKKIPVIDVRSPSEYLKAHIPGAMNIPLFNDKEREVVGTLYVKQGRTEAIRKGFEIVASKFSVLQDSGEKAAENSRLLIYCWRGGMRSASLAWLYSQMGIRVCLLKGGYKSYRRLVRSSLSQELKLNVLGGKTGSGKTEILQILHEQGEQILDLEKYANHKGSAFGSLGEKAQPSNEHFENILLKHFLELDPKQPIWVEDESHNIGRVFIPVELFSQMRSARVFFIELNHESRIIRLVKDYAGYPDTELIGSMDRIYKKLGGLDHSRAVEAIKNGQYDIAAGIALKYYDKTYRYGFDNREDDRKHIIDCSSPSAAENTKTLLKYYRNQPK